MKEDDDYSYIFGKKLTELAKKDNRIVAITAAMASGTGLSHFKETFPDRFFDVEIAEQHAMTMAAGLALGGMIPVISIYSSFAQRAYDQLIHDVALQNAHVVICFDRAGLVGRDGETHQGLYDLAFSKLIPNLTIMAPKDYGELEAMLESAIYDNDGPVIIRYPRGSESLSYPLADKAQIGKGKAEIIRNGDDVTLIAIGKMVAYADKAAKILEDKGIRAKVINVRFFKPLDKETILDNLSERICTLEDGTLCGGLAEVIDSLLVENNLSKAVLHFGYPDHFIAQGSVEELEKVYGLTQEDIAHKIFKTWFE